MSDTDTTQEDTAAGSGSSADVPAHTDPGSEPNQPNAPTQDEELDLRRAMLLPAPETFRGRYAQVAKDYVKAVRAELADAHWAGASGVETQSRLATALDNLIRFIFESSTYRFGRRYTRTRQHCAVLALGGYGRGEQSPYSDVDLLVLHSGAVTPYIETVTEALLYTLWDAGLEVGHAVRNISECVSLAATDLTIKTSLLDGRFICGSAEVAAQYVEQVQDVLASTDVDGFCQAKLAETASRHAKQGGSVFILEPNLKEGQGGLRDLHIALWISRVRRGVSDLDGLLELDILTKHEHAELASAREFFFRARNSLHFVMGGKGDLLTFERQDLVGARLGFQAEGSYSPGDMFMREYYHHAAIIHRTCADVVDRLQASEDKPGLLDRLVRKRALRSGVSVVGNRLVAAKEVFRSDPLELLRIYADSQRLDVTLSADTREAVRQTAGELTAEHASKPEAVAVFMEILRAGDGVYRTLVEMNRVGVLGAFIPEFGRLFCMVQHDYYHVYTVDEHSLIGVRELELLRAGVYEKESPYITRIMRDCDRPDLLYLAMMFHDLGKGYGGDHDEKGAVMACEIGRRLLLNEDDLETLEFLVRNHIHMSTLAQTRDIEEPDLVVEFVKLVRTPRDLRFLYLLTFADMKAVGPQIWNGWKDDLLAELYRRARDVFDKRLVSEADFEERAGRIRARLIEAAAGDDERRRLQEFLNSLPTAYFLSITEERILDHWRLFESIGPARFGYGVLHHPERSFTEFTICAPDRPGLFSQVAGVLSADGLEVFSSRLATSSTGWAFDVFRIDMGGGKARPQEVWDRIGQRLDDVLAGKLDVEELVVREVEKRPAAIGSPKQPRRGLTRVDVRNDVSRTSTVVEVYAADRPALLFRISNAIFRQGLNIQAAIISTHLNEVLDVFYVSDQAGQKIEDPTKQDQVKTAIIECVEASIARGDAAS